MKLYYPKDHYNGNYRGQVFPLLKPFIKDAEFTDAQRIRGYGVSERDFIIVLSIKIADVVVLPMSWYYYFLMQKQDLAYALIDEARQMGKQVWSINSGDMGVKLPQFENLIVFRQGGYVSKQQLGHRGFPSIVSDYISKQQLEDGFLNCSYTTRPIVGFCGQANPSKYNALKEMTNQVVRNVQSKLGLRHTELQQILPTSYLRASLLELLESNKEVDNRFIKRRKYRAGVTENKEMHSTTKEFYRNIMESQYVLCVRGAGNFSVRFYETLMMGRIPLYVHTDGFLPLSDLIDWRNHVVWVDYKDRHNISQILLDFHKQLDQHSLCALFKKNRKLWEDKFTLSGFFEAQKLQVHPGDNTI
ncbi:exostosin domain-containing protein [Winogradskyella forsetii]|uniref:exostosin domain-containing protein n=1 Tax=Winogradskyella forsetii TaxID=2686077 RepID=UPI0015BC5B88|nr:exostosin family protein [Winogradskyella forsetii]